MRNYPRNSPQAAARIVALTLLADGHIDKAEIDTLDRVDTARSIEKLLNFGALNKIFRHFHFSQSYREKRY